MAGEWVDLPFSDAVLVNPPVPLKRGRRYPFVDMGAVSPGSRCVYAKEEREFSGGGARFKHGDTLMARITPCLENGKIARFCAPDGSGVGHGSTEFIVVRGRPDVTDTDFAYYLTQWEEVRTYAVGQMTGTSGRQRVPTDSLGHLSIPIPPVQEQRALARILGALDDKIECLWRMSETLEAMAQALFNSWFVDFAPVCAKAEGRDPGVPRPVADLFPEEFRGSDIGAVPEGWRVDSFADHFDVTKGLSYKGKFLAPDGLGLPMHNLNSVYEGGGYKHEGLKWYMGEYQDRHLVRPGDVIVTNTEQGFEFLLIGYAAIVPKRYGQCGLFSHHLYRVRPNATSKIRSEFIYLMLRTQAIHDVVAGYTNGTTVNMLPADGLQKPKFAVPSQPVLECFQAFVEPLLERADDLYSETRTLASIRDAFLPKLLSGEIRIRDAEKFVEAAV